MAGAGGGKSYIYMLAGGGAAIGIGTAAHHSLPTWAHAALLGAGGLATVFGSCEALIQSVERIGKRLGWNPFVAGTMAGLASNVPELVMLGFVLAAAPRIGFIVSCLTLHVGALALGLYSLFLPRDAKGHAELPEALVKITTDLFAAAAGVFLGTGLVMLMLRTFSAGNHGGTGLGVADLYVVGFALLGVQGIAIWQLVKNFAGGAQEDGNEERPGWGGIAGFGALGLTASVIGGHAVGDFADILVAGLERAGYSEMVGAILLSLFASAGAFAMIITSHAKKMYDVALASAAGQVSQVPFVVLPVALIVLAVLAQTGVIAIAPSGAVLPIDLETTSVMLMAFPPMLLLWKAIQDDGTVNWVETAAMLCVFGIGVYMLAVHG